MKSHLISLLTAWTLFGTTLVPIRDYAYVTQATAANDGSPANIAISVGADETLIVFSNSGIALTTPTIDLDPDDTPDTTLTVAQFGTSYRIHGWVWCRAASTTQVNITDAGQTFDWAIAAVYSGIVSTSCVQDHDAASANAVTVVTPSMDYTSAALVVGGGDAINNPAPNDGTQRGTDVDGPTLSGILSDKRVTGSGTTTITIDQDSSGAMALIGAVLEESVGGGGPNVGRGAINNGKSGLSLFFERPISVGLKRIYIWRKK